MDEIAEKKKGKLEIFAQTGHSNYRPKNFRFKKFLNEKEFEEMIEKSTLIIGHGGAGIIINSLNKNKKIIIMPRLKELREHTDSHQKDIAAELGKEKKVIVVFNENDLLKAIETIHEFTPSTKNNAKKISLELQAFVEKNS